MNFIFKWQNNILRTSAAPVSLQDMTDEELEHANVSKYTRHTSFQNVFHNRLQQMPGKWERAQITIDTVTKHTIGNRTKFTDKTYGPFRMEVPKLSKSDMYKFLMYTLLQNNFTVYTFNRKYSLNWTYYHNAKWVVLRRSQSWGP